MTWRDVIMGCVTPTGCSVMRFVSRLQQPSFANDITGTVCFNHVTVEHN